MVGNDRSGHPSKRLVGMAQEIVWKGIQGVVTASTTNTSGQHNVSILFPNEKNVRLRASSGESGPVQGFFGPHTFLQPGRYIGTFVTSMHDIHRQT